MTSTDWKNPGINQLYDRPVPSRRGGPLYNAFSYPTKIDPEAIALFIACHTAPGDTVLDVFAGSGTTGLAANLCETPTESMRVRASQLGLPVEWGPRSVVLYELSVIGALLSETMTNPPDPLAFELAARNLIRRVSGGLGWLYSAEDPDGQQGQLRHIIWTEVLTCPLCSGESTFWELAVTRYPVKIHRSGRCTVCGVWIKLGRMKRVLESIMDPVMDEPLIGRVRRPAFVYGRTGSRTWSRTTTLSDLRTLERVSETAIPRTVPTHRIYKGDLYRAGYHQGLDRVHHFYTRRNLITLGTLWQEIENEPVELQQALRLLVLSYNASHSTLMTRVVGKKTAPDFVVTGAQSGVLYVSSLPVEKNIFDGILRKLRVFRRAFDVSFQCQSSIQVVNGSSTIIDLADSSVDYVFTDPPFGDYIPYAEVNQINEAWLGTLTDRSDEVVISRAQQKTASDYATLLKRVFSEVSRVIKPTAPVTVIFNSSKPVVWQALGDAFDSNDLSIARSSLLDKTQVSFKQLVSDRGRRGDAVFLLQKNHNRLSPKYSPSLDDRIAALWARYGPDVSLQHLYTRYITMCMEAKEPVEVEFHDFSSSVETLLARSLEV